MTITRSRVSGVTTAVVSPHPGLHSASRSVRWVLSNGVNFPAISGVRSGAKVVEKLGLGALSDTSSVHVYDATTLRLLSSIPIGYSQITTLTFSPDERFLNDARRRTNTAIVQVDERAVNGEGLLNLAPEVLVFGDGLGRIGHAARRGQDAADAAFAE